MGMRHETAFIGGQDAGGPGEVEVLDPSTGHAFATTPDCGPEQVDQAVMAARAAAGAWRRTAVADRAAVLRRLAALIDAGREELGRLESQQTGKPLTQGRRDAELTARYFDFYASAVETFYGSTIPLNSGNLVYTDWEPHGVTAHVIPWNYPMQILGRSVAPALAVGNATVLKPAEEAPLTALRLARMAVEAGLPPGVFNVVTGYGESAGAALVAHQGVDHVSFTGSVEVGKLISAAAAARVIPVTMELGGKSPNVVFADADLDRAVPVIVNSIIQMAGQTCSAGARLLVQRPVHDELVAAIGKAFSGLTIGPALDDPHLGPLISGPQRERVLGYLAGAGPGGGATVLAGGHPLSGGVYGDGFFVEPTLIDDVDPASPLGQEEIFGPVLTVSSFDDEAEAVALANGTDYGLVAGVWTGDVGTAHRMIRDIDAGQVFVNTYGASGGVELPFGGVKRSGHGREKGAEGLRGFARLKTGVIAL